MRALTMLTVVLAPVLVAAQAGLPPLFLREGWRQRDRPPDAAADFGPEGGVDTAPGTKPRPRARRPRRLVPGGGRASARRHQSGPGASSLRSEREKRPRLSEAAACRID